MAGLRNLGVNNQYSWQDSAYEAAHKEEMEDPDATTYPTPELIIAKKNIDGNYAPSDFVLAWKFNILSLDPYINVAIYINAHTGTFIKQNTNILEGTASSLLYNYGTNVYIDTRWRGGLHSHHVLRSDDANAPKIWTKRAITLDASKMAVQKFGGYNCIANINCTQNTFDDDDTWHDQTAVTAHWLATQTWNYWKNTFNRNSWNNGDEEVKVLFDANFVNATYDNNEKVMVFGKYFGLSMATWDIVPHEFTHGVVHYTADLVYQKEPGALNESFADIFGYEVERYINGGAHTNWTMGEHSWLTRQFDHPSSKQDPAFYKGAYWYDVTGCNPNGSNDVCGVHTNSGVQNYWFYLLSTGSAGAPDGTYNNITVNGIGADKARNIAFYNLDNYLGNNSVYTDSRFGSCIAAAAIYGGCNNEIIETWNAWCAVGLGQPITPVTITGPGMISYYGNTNSIIGGMPKNYSASGGWPNVYNWSYSGSWTWSLHTQAVSKDVFRISNFNNSYVTTTITVSDVCNNTASKRISFLNLDIPYDFPVEISPNPVAVGLLHVEGGWDVGEEYPPIQVLIYDHQGGLKIDNTYQNDTEIFVEVGSLIPGNYHLIVRQGDRMGYAQFVKQ